MTRGALFDAFACKLIAIRAKMFAIAGAWRSHSGCSGSAQFPDVFRVTRYGNKRPSTRTTRVLKFCPRCVTAGEAKHVSRFEVAFPTALRSCFGEPARRQ